MESSGLNVRKIVEEEDESGQDDDLSSWLFHPGISYSFLSSPRNTWRPVRGRGETAANQREELGVLINRIAGREQGYRAVILQVPNFGASTGQETLDYFDGS